jgi:hypothetical protein
MPPGLSEKRRLSQSSSFLYTTIASSLEDQEGENKDYTAFVGPYFTMPNPLHLVGNADASQNDHLALVVDGTSRLYGDLTVLNAEGETDVFHISATSASVGGMYES